RGAGGGDHQADEEADRDDEATDYPAEEHELPHARLLCRPGVPKRDQTPAPYKRPVLWPAPQSAPRSPLDRSSSDAGITITSGRIFRRSSRNSAALPTTTTEACAGVT